jgi:hypothetical protein
MNNLPRMVSNCDLPYLNLPSGQNYRHEALVLHQGPLGSATDNRHSETGASAYSCLLLQKPNEIRPLKTNIIYKRVAINNMKAR